MKKIDKINCLPQKVLPSIFDDSLSTIELLSKIITTVNSLIDSLNSGFTEEFEKYFNSVMINAIYNEENETITLKRELIAGDGVHVFNASTNTMTIE